MMRAYLFFSTAEALARLWPVTNRMDMIHEH